MIARFTVTLRFTCTCLLLSERASLCKIVPTWQFGLWTPWFRWCLHMSSWMWWCTTAAWAGACPSPAPRQNSTLTPPHITLVGVDTVCKTISVWDSVERWFKNVILNYLPGWCNCSPCIAVACLYCSEICLCKHAQGCSWNIVLPFFSPFILQMLPACSTLELCT